MQFINNNFLLTCQLSRSPARRTECGSHLPNEAALAEMRGRAPGRDPKKQWGCCVQTPREQGLHPPVQLGMLVCREPILPGGVLLHFSDFFSH